QRPSWAIIPFEKLSPRWKVLQVDGISPIHKDFNLQQYALSAPLSLEGNPRAAELVASVYGEKAGDALLPLNRDPRRMTVLAMTGVTALVRATAATMESQGITYPAQDIGGLLSGADLTHISNEVAFSKDCPAPDPNTESMTFCSASKYIELLEFVGTDIVEMSGDHFADWSQEAMLYTLDLYQQHKWLVYGGGANLQEGRKPISVQDHGNRLAFIGCNAKGAPYATASDTNPGAVICDFDYMHKEISRLRTESVLPVATFQHVEYYVYEAQPDQIKDFRGMAQAGAVIVSGSQAHQPQAMEFYKDEKTANESFIHYGLGNLFFDQYNLSEDTRQAFIDQHVFYDNRYISTELVPIIFIDFARSRRMTAAEAQPLLQKVFTASGW
ncbi:MAG: CapA family protein, partial [Chloroflexota bacterium]